MMILGPLGTGRGSSQVVLVLSREWGHGLWRLELGII